MSEKLDKLAQGLDLSTSDDRAIFRQRVERLYRNAKRRLFDPRKIADEYIARKS